MTPAHIVMSPSVVVMALVANRFTSRPALKSTLPSVVVMAPATLMSRPQHTTKFPFVAVIAKFRFTSRPAFNVRVVVVGAAVQLTASSTLISPLPGVDEKIVVMGGVPGAVEPLPDMVLITTLFVTSRAESVAPEMSPPMGAIVKSNGSMENVPVRPLGARVVTTAVLAIFTLAADASITPPLPPFGALASSVPLSFTWPFCMSPSRLIVPLRFSSVRASITPVLLTAERRSMLAPMAVINTLPPSALIVPPFSARAFSAPLVTATFSKPFPATSTVTASPATSATVPSLAEIKPLLPTLPPSNAT